MRLRLHKSHVTCNPASCKCMVLVSLAGCSQWPQTKPCCAPSSKWDAAAAVSSRVLCCVQLAVLMDLNIFQLAIAVNVSGFASICTSTMHESRAEGLSQSMLSKVLVASSWLQSVLNSPVSEDMLFFNTSLVFDSGAVDALAAALQVVAIHLPL